MPLTHFHHCLVCDFLFVLSQSWAAVRLLSAVFHSGGKWTSYFLSNHLLLGPVFKHTGKPRRETFIQIALYLNRWNKNEYIHGNMGKNKMNNNIFDILQKD